MLSVRTPEKFAKATATAAIVPVWITKNSAQPKRKPIEGPKASRRKTYCPPARGHIAASSAQHRAPVIVRTPARAQATSSQPGAPTSLEDSAETIKIPEPIIEPTTIMVASNKPRPRTSLGAELFVSWLIDSCPYSCPTMRMSRKTLLDTARGAPIVLPRSNVHKAETDLPNDWLKQSTNYSPSGSTKKGKTTDS